MFPQVGGIWLGMTWKAVLEARMQGSLPGAETATDPHGGWGLYLSARRQGEHFTLGQCCHL